MRVPPLADSAGVAPSAERMAVNRCRLLFTSESFVLRDVPAVGDSPAAASVDDTVGNPFRKLLPHGMPVNPGWLGYWRKFSAATYGRAPVPAITMPAQDQSPSIIVRHPSPHPRKAFKAPVLGRPAARASQVVVQDAGFEDLGHHEHGRADQAGVTSQAENSGSGNPKDRIHGDAAW